MTIWELDSQPTADHGDCRMCPHEKRKEHWIKMLLRFRFWCCRLAARDEAEARPGSQSPAGEGHHSNSKIELVWDLLCKPEAGEGRHDEVQCHISALRRGSQSPRRGRRPEGQSHYSFLFLLFLLALRLDGAKLWKLRKSPWQLAVGLAVGGWLWTHVSFVRLCLKVSRLKWGFSRTATSLGMPASTLLLLRVQGNR